jgi:hypothetical protein
VQYLGGFFHQIKMYQRIGRKDSIQAACLRMRRLYFEFNGSELKPLLKKSRSKLKNQKTPVAVDALS